MFLMWGAWTTAPGNLEAAAGRNWDCSAIAWAPKGTAGCGWTAIGWAAITWGRGYGAAMVCRECAEGMGTGIGMEGVWVAYTCCIAVYCAPCHWPVVGWGSAWAGPEGLPRLLVLFVDRGVRPVPPAWSASHSLQSSSPILGSSSCKRCVCLWFLEFRFLIKSQHHSAIRYQFRVKLNAKGDRSPSPDEFIFPTAFSQASIVHDSNVVRMILKCFEKNKGHL